MTTFPHKDTKKSLPTEGHSPSRRFDKDVERWRGGTTDQTHTNNKPYNQRTTNKAKNDQEAGCWFGLALLALLCYYVYSV